MQQYDTIYGYVNEENHFVTLQARSGLGLQASYLIVDNVLATLDIMHAKNQLKTYTRNINQETFEFDKPEIVRFTLKTLPLAIFQVWVLPTGSDVWSQIGFPPAAHNFVDIPLNWIPFFTEFTHGGVIPKHTPERFELRGTKSGRIHITDTMKNQ